MPNSPYFSSTWDNQGANVFDLTLLNQLLSAAGRAAIVQTWVSLHGPAICNLQSPGDSITPPFVAVGNNSLLCVYIAGCSQLSQALGYVSSALNLPSVPGWAQWNPSVAQAALRIITAIQAVQPATARVRCVGHSLGGAIALATLYRLSVLSLQPTQFEGVTYGSPKPGLASIQRNLSGLRVQRIMLDADPVPIILPSLADFGVQQPNILLNALRIYSTYGQPHGGVVLKDNLTAVEGPLPTNAASNFPSSLSAWLLSLDMPSNPFHSVSTYAQWFYLFQHQGPVNTSEPISPRLSGPSLIQPIASRDRTRAENAQASAIATAAAQQQVPDVRLPPQNYFSASRISGTWVVTFGDEIVAYAGNKRQARGFARMGNAWLRRMLTTAVVDPNALTAQFQAFLTAAVDPTSGVVPTLNVGL